RIAFLAVGLCVATLCVAAPRDREKATREPMTKDGKFTICEFQDFDHCELLTEKALKKYRFTAEEKQKLKDLQRFAAVTEAVPLADLEKSFGRYYKIFPRDAPNQRTIVWYRDSIGLNDLHAKCPECGVYISLADDVPTDLFYIVEEKFTVVWYR